MNKYENAVEQLKNGITTYIDKKIEDVPFDRTFTALITKVSSNNTYSVLLNGVEYNNIRTIGGECYVNETVKVLVPQDNYNNMFILKAIEDAGNYKLYDYTNENDIALVEGEIADCKKYTWETKGNECLFILDNEYYVTDDELYLTKGVNIKGAFFVDSDVYSPEYVNVYTTGIYKYGQSEKFCGYIVNEKDSSTKITYQYINFINCRVFTIDNDENHYAIEGTSGRFPSETYRTNWATNYNSTYWGAKSDTNSCVGYLTTNIPIFENNDDATAYMNGDKNVLEKAINYKPTSYKEIFSTSVLMNNDSKLKIDMEILMDYNSEEYYHNNKNYLKLPYGKGYGYSGFDCNLALRETFNRFILNYVLNNKNNSSRNWGFFIDRITYSNYRYCLNGILARITNVVLGGRKNNSILFYIDYGINVSIYDNAQIIPKKISGSGSDINLYADNGNHYEVVYGQTISDDYITLNLSIDTDTNRRSRGISEFTEGSYDFDGKWKKNENLYLNLGDTNSINNETYFNGNHIYIAKDIPIYHYPLWFYGNTPIYIHNSSNEIVGRFYNADAGDFNLYNPKFELIKNFCENLKIRYKVNNEIVENKKPKVAISEDGNIIRLMYILSSEESGLKTFSVEAGISKGIGIIDKDNITVAISGTGLLDQTFWNGDIEVDELFELINPINPMIVSCTEDVNVVIIDRPIMRDKYWGYMLPYTWGQVGDDYIW